MAEIYLTSARKCWHYDVPAGWSETHWERGNYIECGVFTKPDSELTDEDKEWVEWHGEIPEDWNSPEPLDEPILITDE